MIVAEVPAAEERRIAAIRYLAKVNPVRYEARYVQGRLELFQNLAWDIKGKCGQWYVWEKFHT